GLTDALHGLRHRRTASLSLDAHGGHGGGDAHHVTLGEARLSARASETLRHLYDLRLCGREVVAEPDDSGTVTADIALRSAHDVHKPGERRSRLLGRHVRRLAHINHRARKPEHVRRLDTKLARSLSDRRNLRVRGGKLASKTPKARLQRLHLRSRAVNRLLHTSPRRFPIHRGLRRQPQSAQGRGTERSQRRASRSPRLPIVLRRLHQATHSRVGLSRRLLRALADLLSLLRRLRHRLVKALHLGPEPNNNRPVSQRAPPIPARRPNHYTLNACLARARVG